MSKYVISDGNATTEESTFEDALSAVEEWYDDYASWGSGSASEEETAKIRQAISKVQSPSEDEGLKGLKHYASSICESIAESVGAEDFYGHGNYFVSAASRLGLYLTVDLEDDEEE